MLLFLALPVIAYELGIWLLGANAGPGAGGGVTTINKSHKLLVDLFSVFGASGLYLPGLLVVTMLMVWHMLARHRWEFHVGVPLLMAVESLVLALPLLVADKLIQGLGVVTEVAGVGASWLHASSTSGPALQTMMMMSGEGAAAATAVNWQLKLVLSVGAGIYEELLFRMLVIALIHFIAVDILRAPQRWGTLVGIVVSALIFTIYHDIGSLAAGTFAWRKATFLFVAGLYLGGLFVSRGFGIAVGTHAIYDILVTVLLPLTAAAP